MQFRTLKRVWRQIVFVCIFIACAAGTYYWLTKTNEEQVFARVNEEEITAREFLHRYREYLTASQIKDNLATRRIVLRSMIWERLMSADAHVRGWDTCAEYREMQQSATMQVLLDMFRRNVLYDSVRISENDLKRAFYRQNTKLHVRHLFAKTEVEAQALRHELDLGATFDELAKKTFHDPHLASTGGDLGFVGFGEMDPAFEEAAFAMKPGEISEPVRTANGYSIIKLEKIVTKPLSSGYDYMLAREKLFGLVRSEKFLKEDNRFATGLSNERHPNFNEPVLRAMYAQWGSMTTEGPKEQPAIIDSSLSGRIVMTYDGGFLTVNDVMKKTEFLPAKIMKNVASPEDLKQVVLGLFSRDLVLEKAKEANLLEDRGLQSLVNKATAYYLWTRWRDMASDTVEYQDSLPPGTSPQDTAAWRVRHEQQDRFFKRYFDKKVEVYRTPDEVRVREIFVYDKVTAVDMMKRCTEGEDMVALARKYSKRDWAAAKGGDLGFHTADEYGDLGKKILESPKGALIGPIPLDSGYSVIRILDKRPGREKTYEEARGDIAEEFRPKWENIAFAYALNALQSKSHVVVDYEALRQLPLVNPLLQVEGQ